MKDAESLKFSITSTGNSLVDSRKPCNLNPVDLGIVYSYIDKLVQDKRVNEETKKIAATYPQGSLATFCKNVRTYIGRAQRKVALTPIKYECELGDEKQSKKQERIQNVPDEFE